MLVVCLFLSGLAALTLELVWSRSLRLVFGSSTLAVSSVLVAYMLGLGLGGLLAGRFAARVRNPARVYGLVEVAIGLYAWCVPSLLATLPGLDANLTGLVPPSALALIRFFLVLTVLVVPTFLMGATLPLLTSTWVGASARVAPGVGLLYGVNTLGAVVGILAATFIFLPRLGLTGTNHLGAALALAVGIVAVTLIAPWVRTSTPAHTLSPIPGNAELQLGAKARVSARRSRSGGELQETREAAPTTRWNRWLLSYATVGFSALAYEVCWFRALAMVVGSSVYAFATMLAAFLLGIGLGSLVARSWWQRRQHPEADYALALAALGSSAWVTIMVLASAPRWFVQIVDVAGISPTAITAVSGLIAVLAMLVPTLILGAMFPGVLRLVAIDRTPSAAAGDVYFANTIGSALGAFSAGFVMIPYLGLQQTMSWLVALNLAVAAWLLASTRVWSSSRRRMAVTGIGFAAVVTPILPSTWNPAELNRGVFQLLLDADDWRVGYEALTGVAPDGLLFHREGINTTVAVEQRAGERVLRVNGKPDAGSAGDMPTQVLLGQLPFLYGARAERVLVVGLASGVTVGSAALFEPEVLDVVELEPAMVEASHFFDDINHRPLDRHGVRVIIEDGRILLARRPSAYDVIISEPSNPWISGVANLFTREFFREAREALQPHGVLLQWVQLYGLAPQAWTSILAALQAEFPYVYVFSHSGLTGGDSLIMATQRRLTAPDFPRWENLRPEVRADLERVGLFDTPDLWSLLRLGPEEVALLAQEAPVVNSDDNLFVELTAPRTLHDADALGAVRQRLEAFHGGALPLLADAGMELDDEQLGALALAYATGRREVGLAQALLARRPGSLAWQQTLQAMILARRDDVTVVDTRQARALVDAARQAYPDSPSLQRHRATVLYDLGDREAALAELDGFLRLQPKHVRARAERLRLRLELGQLQAARSEAEELLATSYATFDRELAMLAALAAARLGDLPAAIVHVQRHLATEPNDPYAWRMLGEMLTATGAADESRSAYANAERARRNRARQRFVGALRLQRFGDSDAAAAELRQVIEELPEFAPARRALARLEQKRQL